MKINKDQSKQDLEFEEVEFKDGKLIIKKNT